MSKARKVTMVATALVAILFFQSFTSATPTTSAVDATWNSTTTPLWNTYVTDVAKLLQLSLKAYGTFNTNNVVVAASNNALANASLNGYTFISYYDGFDAALKNFYQFTPNAQVLAQWNQTYADFKAWRTAALPASYPPAY